MSTASELHDWDPDSTYLSRHNGTTRTHDITGLGLVAPLLLTLIRRNLIESLLLALPTAHAPGRGRRKLKAKAARVESWLTTRRELGRCGRRRRRVIVERRVLLVQVVCCQVRLWVGEGGRRGRVGAGRAGDRRSGRGSCGGGREVEGAFDRRSGGHRGRYDGSGQQCVSIWVGR